MKKRLFFLLLLIFALSAASCGGGEEIDFEAEEAELDAVSSSMEGTLTEFTGTEVSVTTEEGESYTMNCERVQIQCKNGLAPGNQVQLLYVGALDGTDTSNVKVRKIITQDDNTGLVDSVKAAQEALKEKDEELREKTSSTGYGLPKSHTSVKEITVEAQILSGVNVRADAQGGSEILGSLDAGEEVTVTGICENGWLRILYEDQTAFIWQDFAEW